MSERDAALAFIAECEAVTDVTVKAELKPTVDRLKAALQSSRDLDAQLTKVVQAKTVAERQTLATAIKASLPGLWGEDCTIVAGR